MEMTGFEKELGNGKPRKDEPKSTFMSRITKAAVADLKHIGNFRKTNGGELFYILEQPTGAVVPLANNSIELHTLVMRRFNVNAASKDIYSALLTGFQIEAFQYGKEVVVHQFSHADIDTKTLYVSLLDEASMLKIDDTGISQVSNGTDGVFFLDPPNWKAWSLLDKHEEGVAKELLVDSVDFANTSILTKEDQALLYEMWIRGLFLDPSNKPLLALVGPSQAGKTSNLECVKATIAGPAGKAETISREDAFKAAVAADPLFIIDNLDEIQSRP